ncbi:MAG: uL15m family ribosomal protein [Nanoarchaeota archaeon]|nr:uL15m family ribosomal protein [Nanoarchaeota archaeon]
MVVRRKRRNVKFRGNTTHGWGAMKKHRGAGNRGGRGMAGTGKRADTIKPMIWSETYFGKFGFIKKNKVKKLHPVNISYVEQHLEKLINEKKITEEKGTYVIDAEKLSWRILGDGKVTKKFKITTSKISQKGKEKIEGAGGQVILKEKLKPAKEAGKPNKAKA